MNTTVAIVMFKSAQICLEEWEPISERITRATFKSRHMKLTILQCYAPTNESTDEEKDYNYKQ
jgi:exonuclease III